MLLVRLVDEWASFLPAATFDSFRADLGLSYRAAALALLAIGPGAIAGSAAVLFADRRSRRVLATAGAATYAGALALFAAATNSWMLVSGGFAVGFGATLLVDTVEVALAHLAGGDGSRLERALARVNVAAGVGDLAAPLIVAAAAARGWSWRVPLWFTAVAAAGYATLVAATPLPAPAVPVAPGHGRPARPQPGARELARRRSVWRAGACGALLVALDESFVAFVIAYLRHDDGMSTAHATVIAAVFVGGGLTAAAGLARTDRPRTPSRRRRALRTAAATMLAGAVLLAIWPLPAVIACCGFVIGAATVAFWVPFHAATLQLVPGRAAIVTALVGTIEMAGLAAAPVIGAVSDAWGLRAGLGAYCLLPALLVFLVRRVR